MDQVIWEISVKKRLGRGGVDFLQLSLFPFIMGLLKIIQDLMGTKATLEDYVKNAEEALAKNDMKAAYRESKRALKINPDSITAIKAYVKAGASLSKYTDLEKYCDQLINDDPSSAENWYYKGYIIMKRREPSLPKPKGGFTNADVIAHPFHFTSDYLADLRKGREFLYKAQKLEEESHKNPEYQKSSRIFLLLTREQYQKCTELTCQALNILYDKRAQAEEQRKLRELQSRQDRLITAQCKDPETR